MIIIHRNKTFKELDNKLLELFREILINDECLTISGGKTFRTFLKKIINLDINKFNISLTDDRIVPINSRLSNSGWIENNLIKKTSKKIKLFFFPVSHMNLTFNQLLIKTNKNFNKHIKFSTLFLGVGDDGHLASIFSDVKPIIKKNNFLISKKNNENFYRLTHTMDSLLKFKHIVLVFRGEKKTIIFKENFFDSNLKNQSYNNINVLRKLIRDYSGRLTILTN